jgi:tetratricopeptide (TPR) repeat protein
MNKIPGKYRTILMCAALAIAIFAAFWQVLGYGFTNFDDDIYVTENPHVQGGLSRQSVVWAFRTPYASFWHPLTMLSHMLDCELFGLNPHGHHLTNVLLHIANTLLLFIVLKEMTVGSTRSPQAAIWKSAFVAAAFALHPLHVESVAWVAERKDVLSTLFWMLTMLAYLRYAGHPSAGRYLLTLGLFALGLMAKPMLVTLPFVLLLLDYWPLGRLQFNRLAREQEKNSADIGHKWSRLILEKVPFFVLSAVFSVITIFTQKPKQAVVSAWPAGIRVGNAMVSYLVYIRKTIWPSGLAAFYPYPGDKLSLWEAVVAIAVLLGISVFVIRLIPRYKYLLVGWLLFVGTLVPVIGLVRVGSFAMADRFTYIPLTGLFIIIAWGSDELLASRRRGKIALGISATAVLSALLICTSFQVRYWRNNTTLFEHAIKVTTNNFLAYNNLGVAYGELGRYAEETEAYKQAVKIKPDYADAHYNLAVVYGTLGRYTEAIEAYKQTIKIKPDYADAYYNLGNAYRELGLRTEAIEAFQQAIRTKPDYAEAQNNLGNAYYSLGRWQEAVEAYRQTIALKPDYAEAHYNLGVAYGKLGRWTEAIETYKQAIKIKPDFAEAHYNLGNAYYSLDRWQDAIEAYRQAIKIKPDYADAHFNLGNAYFQIGDKASALEEYKILKSLDAEKADELFSLISPQTATSEAEFDKEQRTDK